MPCHCKHLQESQPQASSLCGAWGEAGPALGPQPNICHDTQIIFVCGWQVLWLRWCLKCVVKVSIIPCSRHCGALEEQPSLQASPLLLAWIARRLLQSCKKQQGEAARYLPSRYVTSRQVTLLWAAASLPLPHPHFVGRGLVLSHMRKADSSILPAPQLAEARFPAWFGELGACQLGGRREPTCQVSGWKGGPMEARLPAPVALNNHYPSRLQRQWADVMAGTATARHLWEPSGNPPAFPWTQLSCAGRFALAAQQRGSLPTPCPHAASVLPAPGAFHPCELLSLV